MAEDKAYKKYIGKILLVFLLSWVALLPDISAQDQEPISKVYIKNGNVHYGTILFEDAETVYLLTFELGEITIQKRDISSVEEIKNLGNRKGKYWIENPVIDRYFAAPSAFNLKKGQVYYQNTLILGNQVNVGITDKISAEGGFLAFQDSGLNGRLSSWARVKVNVPLDAKKFRLGVGAFYASLLQESPIGFGNFFTNDGVNIYTVGTYGSSYNQVSLGLSYGVWNGEWENAPVANLSGQFKIRYSTSFLFELYSFLPFRIKRLGIIGLRNDWKNVSFSYGLIPFVREEADFQNIIPWFALTVRLGKAWD